MKKKLMISIAIALAAITILLISFFCFELTAVDKRETVNISFVVKKGESKKQIINNLKNRNLIRSRSVAYIYSYLNKEYVFKPGTYNFKRNMNLKTIFTLLHYGNTKEKNGVNIIFKEGKRYTDYISLITLNKDLSISEDDFKNLMNDKDYLNALVNEYWFLTEDILTEDIYYPLEGYLFPDTYNFSLDATAKDVIKIMLDNTQLKLSDYRVNISKSSFNIHQIMTLASILELEGSNNSDLKGIASVFINRINAKMTLGSDVTTYYAAKKTFKDDLSTIELNECNAYNTRGTCFYGLPVGPVSNPGIKAIDAALNPTDSDYLFFVSDNSGKIYFSKTNAEHEKIVAKLKQEGNWYIYE